MKLCLVILLGGLCILTVQGRIEDGTQSGNSLEYEDIDQFEGDTGFVQNLLNEMIDKVEDFVTKHTTILTTTLNKLVDKILLDVTNLANRSLENTRKLINNAHVSAMLHRKNNGIVCFDHYRQILEEIFSKAKKDVQNCVIQAIAEIYQVKGEVEKYIHAIRDSGKDLIELLRKCIRPLNPFYTIKCLTQNVSEIIKTLQNIVSNAVQAIKEAGKELQKILLDLKVCVLKVATEAETNVKEVLIEIRSCLENGVPTEPPSTTEGTTETKPSTESSSSESPTTETSTIEPSIESSSSEPATTETSTIEPSMESSSSEPPTTETSTIEPSIESSSSEPGTTEISYTELTTNLPASESYTNTQSPVSTS